MPKGVDGLPKIVNELYAKFADKTNPEFVKTIGKDQFKAMLDNIEYNTKDKTQQARALSIIAYYTGLRPVEILALTPTQFTKDRMDLALQVVPAKGGRAGTLLIPMGPLLREAYDYVKKGIPTAPAFYQFISYNKNNKVTWTTKDGETKTRNYPRTTRNINYFANKWFGFPFYFFRHNRFTRMSEAGATMDDIKEAKLAKDIRSVDPYVAYSRVKAKKRRKFYV